MTHTALLCFLLLRYEYFANIALLLVYITQNSIKETTKLQNKEKLSIHMCLIQIRTVGINTMSGIQMPRTIYTMKNKVNGVIILTPESITNAKQFRHKKQRNRYQCDINAIHCHKLE